MKTRRKIHKRKLTPKQKKFVEAYTDVNSPTYRNGHASIKEAYPDVGDNNARSMANQNLNKPSIQKEIRELLAEDTELDRYLFDGLKYRMSDPSLDNKHWQAASELFSKLKGVLAPDKQVVMNITPQERDEKYKELIDKIRKAQQDRNKSPDDVDTPIHAEYSTKTRSS